MRRMTTTKLPTVGELSDAELYRLAASWAGAWFSKLRPDAILDVDDLAQEIAAKLTLYRRDHPEMPVSRVGWEAKCESDVAGTTSMRKRSRRIRAMLSETPEWIAATPAERRAMFVAATKREKVSRNIVEEVPFARGHRSPGVGTDDEAVGSVLCEGLVAAIHVAIEQCGFPGRDVAIRRDAHKLLDAYERGATFLSESGVRPGATTEARRLLRRAAARATGQYDLEALPAGRRVDPVEEVGWPEPEDDAWLDEIA